MCDTYAPLHVHSHYSLLDGLPSPKRIAERCKELGLPACAITDHGNLFGMVAFHDACKKVGIKPIIGIELYMCDADPAIKARENSKRHHLTVLARNEEGVNTLMRLVSETNRPDYYYYKPRIDLERLSPFAKDGNLLCLSGCMAGKLSSSLFGENFDEACKISGKTDNPNEVRKFLVPDWQDIAAQIALEHQKIFGKDNFYLEIQEEGMAIQKVIVQCLRELAKGIQIPTVATLDAHYACKEDAQDQRILLYSQLHTTQEEQERMKEEGGDSMAFFHLDTFHIFHPDEMQEHYTWAEIQRTLEISDRIQSPKLGRKPCLPKYVAENNDGKPVDSQKLLRDLCIEGAQKKLGHLSQDEKRVYWERLEHELLILNDAGLADYFLIVWDACAFVDRCGGPRGKGRGSGAGSLVNYLLGITGIDPLKYGLFFERFYNPSRNIPPHFSVGQTGFMAWLGDNFERAIKSPASEYREKVAKATRRNRIKNRELLTQEAAWIDENNPKMWMYLADQLPPSEKGENKANSHIAYALGLSDELNPDEPVSTVDGHVSLPDIDTDIGIAFRSRMIEYLNKRWGQDKVAQMITFGRLQGKAALKEVFRAQPDTVKHLMNVRAVKLGKNPAEMAMKPYDLCNEITQYIPDESAIADDLQAAREEHGDGYGILQWSIDHIDQVAEYYRWFKPLFDQAMRLEGTKKSQSKHAAGVVIADRPIEGLMPLAYDPNSKGRICGLEMATVERLGGVKFDFLGVGALDKIHFAAQLINQGGDDMEIDDELPGEEADV